MQFSTLSEYFQRLEKTPSRIAMTEILAELFHAAHVDEIGNICFLLQGRVAPLYEPIEFGVADRFMIRAISKAYNVDEKHTATVFKKQGDLGTAAEEIAREKRGKDTEKFSVNEVFHKFEAITKQSGAGSQEEKIRHIAELLNCVDPLSARYIVRIPLGKLRLGFSDKTILDGLSWMISKDKSHKDALEGAYDVRPDLSFIATSVKKNGISGISDVHAKVGAPILAALCQRLPNAVEMIKKMGEVDVTPKYDGVRTQIHFIKTKEKNHLSVQTFSRNLENTTAMYPELEHIDKQINASDVILDTEAVGYDAAHDRLIPFQETVTRKRKHGIGSASKTVPLKFFVFDILYKDGEDLMATPLSKRREILEQTIIKGNILTVSPHIVTTDVEKLRQYHETQIKKGLEGVVVKKWDSVYVPGRRGYNWVKFKEEGKTGKLADTIDCVVMGYSCGEGKRSSFGIGAFLVGVGNGEKVISVSKIGTGVSDELWKELETNFKKLQSKEKPKEYGDVDKALAPDYWIEPKVVVEIAADDITVSPIHGAGYALRFPRLVRIRTDKSVRDITTLSELKTMYKNQESIHEK